MKIKKRVLYIIFLAVASIAMATFFVGKYKNKISKNVITPSVLSKSDERAVFIYKNNNYYKRGGLIEIASTDNPVVKIGSIGISGSAEITTYQASYDDLLNYLIHNNEYKQKNKSIDVTKLSQVSQEFFQVNSDKDSAMPLSISDNGIWFVRANLDGVVGEAFVIRTDIGAIASEGDNQIIIWSQNFKTKKLIPGSVVSVYDLDSSVKRIEMTTSDNEGIAKIKATQHADIAIVESSGKKAILPLNYKYLNVGNYASFHKKNLDNEYFVFTDRPLYRPGDNVKFKAIIRQEDDAVFTIPSGKVNAKIFKEYDESSVIAQQNFTISDRGTISGEFNLPANVEAGIYSLVVKSRDSKGVWGNNYTSFNVEEFVKPEYGIEATSDDSMLIAGDTVRVAVHGGYFSGQPLAGEEVKYTIFSSSYSDYGYRDDFDPSAKWHWSWGGSKVYEGTAKLNEVGDTTISYKTPNTKERESSKVYTIQVEYVNEGGRPSVSTANVLVKSGEFGIYKKDYSWGANVNKKVTMPFVITDISGKTVAGNVPIKVKTKWSYWKYVKKQDGKFGYKYKKESENLPEQNINGGNGEFAYMFTPSKIGLYEITVQAKDPRGNIIENTYSVWAYSDKEYSRFSEYGLGSMGITVKADKEKYNPGDDAKITILSKELNRDALFTIERGRTRRYKVVHLENNQTILTEKIQNDDIPNVFASVATFGSQDIDSDSTNLLVSTTSKKINVSIKPDRDAYEPGDLVVLDISTTDFNDKPVSTDVAVWAIDKALYELVDSNMRSILDTFWYQRWNNTSSAYSLQGISSFGAEKGGCFVQGTQVSMADGTKKNIENIVVGDSVLTYGGSEKDEMISAKVLKTEDAIESGFLIINKKLRVTPNHILWVNGDWRQAGIVQVGDTLRGIDGDEKVYSIEWKREKAHVYNLEIENQRTYIAENIWVHNDKGGGDDMRTDLKDTAYWNPSLQTDVSGHAKISFKLPDNLTTWVVATVAATDDTRVGQQALDIAVSKKIIVRPMLPNVLQEGDKIALGAIVQNFSDSDQEMRVEASLDSGTIENSIQTMSVAKGESVKIYWNVSPQIANDHAKFSVKATSINEPELNDGVVQELPIKKYGFAEISGYSIMNTGQSLISFPQDARNEKSSVKVEIAASLVGSLSSAMDYLLEYPYGCVEQTTSSFVPAIILKQNKNLFQFKKTDISIDDVVNEGITRLEKLQNNNGGWGWWGQDNKENPFISGYVAEYLLRAENLGYSVDRNMHDKMLSYLKNDSDEAISLEERRLDKIGKTYGLSLIEKGVHPDRQIKNFNGLTPDLLSLVVMANINNGNINPAENGLSTLIQLAKNKNKSFYWDSGDKKYFGSKETSTSLALRALIAGKGDSDLIDKAVNYLVQSRKGQKWQNTFATAEVLQALVDYAKFKKVDIINSSYAVFVDGQQISQRRFTDYRKIDTVEIPLDKLQAKGSQISIRKEGEGDIYSTIIVNAFRTDKNAQAVNRGFSISRTYQPENASIGSPLAVGDVVNVKLTLASDFDDRYIVIKDHLPSGLVPINPKFKNEQASGGGKSAQLTNGKSYMYNNREVTKDGMIISAEYLKGGTNTFTYRARVVSRGEFNVIPAVATKMYSPEIYGRTSAQKISVQKEQVTDALKNVSQKKNGLAFVMDGIVAMLLLAIAGGGYYIWRKKRDGTTLE